MDIPTEVRAAERALAAAGYNVRQFCFKAGIQAETWRIWREGRGLPQMKKWRQAMDALDRIVNADKRARAKKAATKKARQKAAAVRLKRMAGLSYYS